MKAFIDLLFSYYKQTIRITQMNDISISTNRNPHLKKISRIANPFQSSEVLDSNCSDSKLGCSSQKKYEQKKFSNVFKFNDRQRIQISDSQFSSSLVNADESGSNVFNFSPHKNQEKTQDIEVEIQYSNYSQIHRPQQFSNSNKVNQNKYLQKISNHEKFQIKPNDFQNTHFKAWSENEKSISTDVQNNKMKLEYRNDSPSKVVFTYQSPQIVTYQPPQINKYKQQKKFHNQNMQQSKDKNIIKSNNAYFETKNSTQCTNKQAISKKKTTFKPSILTKYEQENSSSKINSSYDKPATSPFQHILLPLQQNINKDQQSFKSQNINAATFTRQSLPQNVYKKQFKQQIQNENVDILISKHDHTIKPNLKAASVLQEKLNLSEGSQVHCYAENIFDNLKNHFQKQNQQQYSKHSTSMQQSHTKKEIEQLKHMVESKLVQDENTKVDSSKKPRKKIFDMKYDKSHKVHSNNHFQSSYLNSQEYTFSKNQELSTPTQCLMKSLDIIDKLAAQKSHMRQQSQKKQGKNQQRIVIVPPPPLTISHSPSKAYQLFPEQIKFRKQILEISFQIASMETTFDLEQFDNNQERKKIKWLNDYSIKLFEQYKHLIISNRISDFQSNQTMIFKQQIMNIRQKSAKLLSLQQKYIQTKAMLCSLQQQLIDILLLDSKEKYCKKKLLNEAIKVMQKTQTYLSLETSKIAVMIKTYVCKQKFQLQQTRDWLNQYFSQHYVCNQKKKGK